MQLMKKQNKRPPFDSLKEHNEEQKYMGRFSL